MNPPPSLVLFVQYAGNWGGSAISGRLILEGICNQGWRAASVFGFYGSYSEQYKELGPTYLVPHRWIGSRTIRSSIRKLFSVLKSGLRFYLLFRKLTPSVVYVNTLVSAPAALAARLAGIPLIWHVRELFEDDQGELVIPRLGGKGLIRCLLRTLPQRVVVVSDAVQRNVVGQETLAKVSVIPNAVPRSYSEPPEPREVLKRELGLPQTSMVVGVPGTLREVKGHAFLLNSIAEVLKNRDDLFVIISGDVNVNYFDILRDLTETQGIARKVRFLGNVEDMRRFYGACDFVCIPSRAEPFGRTVIEAFMAGVPVIATAVGGIQEIIEDEVTGKMVEYGDQEDMRAAIRRFIEDRELRERLARNAQAKARNEYTEAVYQRRVTALIEELLSGE